MLLHVSAPCHGPHPPTGPRRGRPRQRSFAAQTFQQPAFTGDARVCLCVCVCARVRARARSAPYRLQHGSNRSASRERPFNTCCSNIHAHRSNQLSKERNMYLCTALKARAWHAVMSRSTADRTGHVAIVIGVPSSVSS
eukprot:571210-Pelagomonas_calceolata.AAC.5